MSDKPHDALTDEMVNPCYRRYPAHIAHPDETEWDTVICSACGAMMVRTELADHDRKLLLEYERWQMKESVRDMPGMHQWWAKDRVDGFLKERDSHV